MIILMAKVGQIQSLLVETLVIISFTATEMESIRSKLRTQDLMTLLAIHH